MARAPLPKVLIHPDFLRLETELVARIGTVRTAPADPFSPILVLAPSQRQVRRLRRVLAEECGPLLGVEVLHHQAFAYSLLSNDLDASMPRVASRSVLNHLVAEILEGRVDLVPGRHLADHPASLAPIAGLVRELRETGIEARDLRVPPGADRARDMARLLSLYTKAVDVLERTTGLTDRAGLVRRARTAAAAHPPYRAVFQYGAYELVGMNLDLVRSIPTGELVYLVPADATAPAWRYARDFITRHLGTEPEALGDGDGPRPFVRIARCFGMRDGKTNTTPAGDGDDPGNAPTGPAGGSGSPEADSEEAVPDIRLVNVQGPEAELNHAARRALALFAEGTPLPHIAIVARTLEPYAALAETVFARHGMPVDTSAALPLARHPQATTFLLLLRAMARDFERQTVVDLVRSPYIAPPPDVVPSGETGRPGWKPDRWDRWSRRYRIVEGAPAWTDDLPAALGREEPPDWEREDDESRRRFEARRADDLASAGTLAACVRSLSSARDRWRRCRNASAHAAFLREIGARWILDWGRTESAGPGAASRVAGMLLGILDDLEGLDGVDDAVARSVAAAQADRSPRAGSEGESPTDRAARVDPDDAFGIIDALDFVEESVADASVDWSQPGGLAFLDMMQARGLTFDHVFLIGFNADLVPRRPREDLFLPDRLREQWRARSGRPVTVRREGREEEWLLLAQTVAAATRSLTVSWQRADADGKTRSVSLFMRELARRLPKKTKPEHVPTHPARSAAYLARQTELLTREEAALLAAETAPDRSAALDGFIGAFEPDAAESMRPGFGMAGALDDFEGAGTAADALRYDGFLPGGTGWDRPFSASSLDTLGTCPLKFYFRYMLGLHPLEEAGEGFRFEARELGAVVHGLLERIYEDLREAGRLAGDDDPVALVTAGRDALAERWRAAVSPLARRVAPRFPVLFELAEAAWRADVERFLEADLRRLAEEGHRLEATEDDWVETLSLAAGAALLDATEAVRETLGPNPPGAEEISVRGIPDRVTLDRENRRLVTDYKTSGDLSKRVKATEHLRGRFLQLPLYLMLAEARGAEQADAELLGIGPEFSPDADPGRFEPVAYTGGALAKHRSSVEETLVLLARLAREGRFPFHPAHHCTWCDYQSPCRRNHYPTRARVGEHAAYRAYFMSQKKSTRTPTLADVPPPTGEDDS